MTLRLLTSADLLGELLTRAPSKEDNPPGFKHHHGGTRAGLISAILSPGSASTSVFKRQPSAACIGVFASSKTGQVCENAS